MVEKARFNGFSAYQHKERGPIQSSKSIKENVKPKFMPEKISVAEKCISVAAKCISEYFLRARGE